MEILDANGEPIVKPQQPHRFGTFIIPEDARVTFKNLHIEDAPDSNAAVVVAQRKEE